jgi:hypothetical protein
MAGREGTCKFAPIDPVLLGLRGVIPSDIPEIPESKLPAPFTFTQAQFFPKHWYVPKVVKIAPTIVATILTTTRIKVVVSEIFNNFTGY